MPAKENRKPSMQVYPRIHHESRRPRRVGAGGSTDRERRDRELMDALRGGSAAALEERMALYWAPLVGWVARELDDVDAARDLVQETFVQVWQRRARWSSQGSPRAYLFRVTRSLLIDERRRRRVRLRWLVRCRTGEARSAPTPADDLDATRLRDAYLSALARLPERRRETFLLVYIQGLSHAEVAELMEVTPRTVANQVGGALRQLREALRPLVGRDL
jgi:RNA polymerase sigma factor (sigma-70 family)